MSDNRELQEMYRRTVLEHSRHPRNFRRLDAPDRIAEGFNPLCGDKITVYLELGQESIQDIAFEGTGCAISLASASMMMEAIQGQPVLEAGEKAQRAQDMFQSDAESAAQSDIEELQALGGYELTRPVSNARRWRGRHFRPRLMTPPVRPKLAPNN